MRILLFLIFLTLPLSAISVQVIPWDHTLAARKIAIAHGETNIPIMEMHPSARSQALKIPKDATNLRLVDLKLTGEDGLMASIPFKLNPAIRKPLILLIPDKESPIGLRPITIEDDPSSFRWGSFKLFNLTGKDLVFVCEKKALPLAAKPKPITFAPAGKNRNVPIKLFLRTSPDKALYSSIWEHKETLRQLVIVVPQDKLAKNGPVEFKFIVEDSRDLEEQ